MNSQYGSMDGGWDDEGVYSSSGKMTESRVKELIAEHMDYAWPIPHMDHHLQNLRMEIDRTIKAEADRALKDAIRLVFMVLSLKGIVKEIRHEEGFVSDHQIQSRVRDFNYKIESLSRDLNLDVPLDQNYTLESVARQMDEIMKLMGFVEREELEERVEKVRQEMSPIFAMIADPNLVLSERVKSFKLE